MVVATKSEHRARLATPTQRLLHRRGVVYVPAGREAVNDEAVAGVQLLEADLVDRGWLLSAPVRERLTRLDTADLVSVGAEVLADCDALLGADRPHVPLFRGFPDSTPADTLALFVDRVLVVFLQAPAQPCVLCPTEGTVTPVNPCGHLVCQVCFNGSDLSACPICHRRIDPQDPFLRPSRPRPAATATGDPARLRVLHLGGDLLADALAEVRGLLARTTALSPQDAGDLATMLGVLDREDLSWLPRQVPGREGKVLLLGWLLADPIPAAALEVAAGLVDTATDVLRLLVARSGGQSLINRGRIGPVPRPLRRLLLGLLDRVDPAQLVDDMRRHRRAWVAAGERLHPFEHAGRYPSAALAFAAIRGTRLTQPLASMLGAHARQVRHVQVLDGRVRVRSWGRCVEEALAAGDVAAAVERLSQRPGELLRRTDHLLRVAGAANARAQVLAAVKAPAARDLPPVLQVLGAVEAAAPRVAPAVLLSTLGALRSRTAAGGRRVFFPAGRTGTAHVEPDERAPLPKAVVEAAVELLEAEVLRRAATLPAVQRAVVDTELDGIVAPFAERTAARALVTLPRGSVRPLPAGRHVRLFCHWMENSVDGLRVDLDLSVALYGEQWGHVGTCDYTSLRTTGAVHSGDLTSAPPPLGASEFIDLDLEELAAAGVRYAVAAVLSYNDVPFTDMAEAFAGVMVRSAAPESGAVFDARAVEQRFDLTGPGKVTVGFVVDVAERTMCWLDVDARVTGTHHAVHRHRDKLGLIGSTLLDAFRAGSRVTMGELARWHAAARAGEVLVRNGGGLTRYRRRDGESMGAFFARLAGGDGDAEASVGDAAGAALQMVVRGDLPVPAGAEVYALHPAGLDAGEVDLLAAADVAGQLAPAHS